MTGLVATVVYGLPPHEAAAGKHWAGAPCVPENTWFQTPFVHAVSLLFLVSHCCCDPLITVPSNAESAMKPPLANDGPVQ